MTPTPWSQPKSTFSVVMRRACVLALKGDLALVLKARAETHPGSAW
jgi:hypothetical protein